MPLSILYFCLCLCFRFRFKFSFFVFTAFFNIMFALIMQDFYYLTDLRAVK